MMAMFMLPHKRLKADLLLGKTWIVMKLTPHDQKQAWKSIHLNFDGFFAMPDR